MNIKFFIYIKQNQVLNGGENLTSKEEIWRLNNLTWPKIHEPKMWFDCLEKTNIIPVCMNIQRNVISETWQVSISVIASSGQTTSGTLCLIWDTHFKRDNNELKDAQETQPGKEMNEKHNMIRGYERAIWTEPGRLKGKRQSASNTSVLGHKGTL